MRKKVTPPLKEDWKKKNPKNSSHASPFPKQKKGKERKQCHSCWIYNIWNFFPYTSSSAKDVLLFSKFLESFVREEKNKQKKKDLSVVQQQKAT